MCVKLKGSKMTPGQIHSFLTSVGRASGIWGFRDGSQYNARIESLSTIWKNIQLNRGILEVDSFWEKDKQIIRKDKKLMRLGIIYNTEMEFAVITVPAKGIVVQYHHRMPLVLDDEKAEDFLKSSVSPVQLNPELFSLQTNFKVAI